MEWNDTGIVLRLAKHGEQSAIVQLLTARHGRSGGLVKGALKQRGNIWMPGNMLEVTWTGRLAEHLGNYKGELLRPTGAMLLNDRHGLASLQEACALLCQCLAEHEPHPRLFGLTLEWLLWLAEAPRDAAQVQAAYALWQAFLLEELGFGLDVTQCAATGGQEELVYLSPKSGMAVSRAAGEPYRDRIFALPEFFRLGLSKKRQKWLEMAENCGETSQEALAISNHFMYQWVHKALA